MTTAITARDPLGELLATRRDLWRGRQATGFSTLSSGHSELDRLLPDGGWPCGRIVELVPERLGAGDLRLLLPFLAERTRSGQPVVLVAPPLIPCPQVLQAAGFELARLIVIRHRAHALWAAEQCLKSGLCGAISIWPPERMQPRALRRLQLAAEQGPAPAFIHYRPGQSPPPSLATLRLAVRPGPELEILRATGQGGIGRRRLRWHADSSPHRTSIPVAAGDLPSADR